MVLGFRWLPFAHAKGGREAPERFIHRSSSLWRLASAIRKSHWGRKISRAKKERYTVLREHSVLYGDLLTLPGRRTPVYTYRYIFHDDGAFLI